MTTSRSTRGASWGAIAPRATRGHSFAKDEFLGIAYQQADNTASGHTAGSINVRLHQSVDIVHTLSGVTAGDIGQRRVRQCG